MIEPTIVTSPAKLLVGLHLEMSILNNKTHQLWSTFMPRKKEITSSISDDLISLQLYPDGYFDGFNPVKTFTKWAAKEVSDFNNTPDGMFQFTLSEGLYAVFHYKGMSGDPSIFKYIFMQWLPASKYQLNQRPHFEVLGNKYKQGDPNSEEKIWIPVGLKS